MAYVITNLCVGTCDTVCVDACPVDCIAGPTSLDELRDVARAERPVRFPTLQLYIDPDVCICCGACEPECPVGAIFEESGVPQEHQSDIALNANFFESS